MFFEVFKLIILKSYIINVNTTRIKPITIYPCFQMTYAGADLEGGPRCPDTPLKFEKCPFYLGFLEFYKFI